MTVTRTRAGFDLEYVFAQRHARTQSFGTGVKHDAHGGLTLSFLGWAVRPAMIDLEGRRGQPGEASEPAPLQLFHHLAVGETWSMTKRGVVEFRAKK